MLISSEKRLNWYNIYASCSKAFNDHYDEELFTCSAPLIGLSCYKLSIKCIMLHFIKKRCNTASFIRAIMSVVL